MILKKTKQRKTTNEQTNTPLRKKLCSFFLPNRNKEVLLT